MWVVSGNHLPQLGRQGPGLMHSGRPQLHGAGTTSDERMLADRLCYLCEQRMNYRYYPEFLDVVKPHIVVHARHSASDLAYTLVVTVNDLYECKHTFDQHEYMSMRENADWLEYSMQKFMRFVDTGIWSKWFVELLKPESVKAFLDKCMPVIEHVYFAAPSRTDEQKVGRGSLVVVNLKNGQNYREIMHNIEEDPEIMLANLLMVSA